MVWSKVCATCQGNLWLGPAVAKWNSNKTLKTSALSRISLKSCVSELHHGPELDDPFTPLFIRTIPLYVPPSDCDRRTEYINENEFFSYHIPS